MFRPQSLKEMNCNEVHFEVHAHDFNEIIVSGF